MPLNNQGFEYGVLPIINGALSVGDFEHAMIPYILGAANLPPKQVVVHSPVSGYRTSETPTFVMESPPDNNGEALHFRIELSPDSGFSTISSIFDTRDEQDGWEYSTDQGGAWTGFPESGVQEETNVLIRYTPLSPLTLGGYYWRAFGNDLQSLSVSYPINQITVGNKIIVELTGPIETDDYVTSLVPTILTTIAEGGETPAELKLFVTNNAFDDSPTWEDASVAANQSGIAHAFTNKTKTSDKWGVNARIEIYANDTLGDISLDGFGFTFN